MSYEYARTNGSYGGLSMYHGLGNGQDKKHGAQHDDNHGAKHGGLFPFPKGGGKKKSPFQPLLMPSQVRSQIMEQRSDRTARQAERVEQRGERALTEGRDAEAQNWMALSQQLDAKSARQTNKAQQLRLPYTDVPLVPRGIVKQSDEALYDTPVKIADQAAETPTPTTAALTAPAQVPVTLPLMPPPLLYATGMPGPRMPGGPPMMMAPQGRPFMGGRISPANAAAATAALAASYFLFF